MKIYSIVDMMGIVIYATESLEDAKDFIDFKTRDNKSRGIYDELEIETV